MVARAVMNIDFDKREIEIKVPVPHYAPPSKAWPTVIRSQWMERQRV
jgi:hypothetical protein